MRLIAARQCTLEPLLASHAREMFDVLSDPAIYEFENSPPPSEAWLAERYGRLESRGPADGSQTWLNWVLRMPNGELAGYVQATVLGASVSHIAYELNSCYWRQGLGSTSVAAMLDELHSEYGIRTFVAILKASNFRSSALLRKLGFSMASLEQSLQYGAEADELAMIKIADGAGSAPGISVSP